MISPSRAIWCIALAFPSLVAAARIPEPRQSIEELGLPPAAPSRPQVALKAAGQTSFAGFLAITNRETARQFYNLVYAASESVPMEWSGSYVTGTPGTNSTEYLRAVLRRVNYFRAMAGIPAGITFSNEYTRKAQEAALMMGANNAIDHFPPATWRFYTADGAEAAQKSNLSLGNAGPQAVAGQMRDNGGNNAAVGHRRWILLPQTRFMGSGNVPESGTNNSAGVLWVFDPFTFAPRPATRDDFVSWPPPGFVPHQVTYARWSFSYPGADFSSATVSMTSNGVPLSVQLEPIQNGFGENTIVWIPAGLNANNVTSFPRPAADTVYRVTLNNVRIGGSPRTFAYQVTVFDPAVPGPDYFPPLVSGSAQPLAGAGNPYSFTAVSNAGGYDWRQSRITNLTFVDGAENGLTNFTVQAATNLYNVRDSSVRFAGSFSFHLAHTQALSQMLTLNRLLLATTNSSVRLASRLGWATPGQIAKVQVSLDDGSSWLDAYAQPGSNGSGEAGFTVRTVPLSNHAGRTVRVRLNYEYTPGALYFPQASSGVGWYIDDFTLLNFQEVTSSATSMANADRTFTFAPGDVGDYLLDVRPLLFGDYAGEWGPALVVNAVANTAPVVRITGISHGGGNNWIIDFSVLSGTAGTFEVWSSPDIPATFNQQPATIQTIIPGSQYRATVIGSGMSRFFQVRSL